MGDLPAIEVVGASKISTSGGRRRWRPRSAAVVSPVRMATVGVRHGMPRRGPGRRATLA
jgi:hypothetical protein